MRKLMIVESPGKIGKLEAILGSGWVVAASMGHVRDLPERSLGLLGPNLLPQYEVTARGAQVISRLKALTRTCDEVYLATDPDREGEAIAFHLQQTLGLKAPKRCSFRAIDADHVIAAVEASRALDMHLVRAQEARRSLDRLVGYTVSPKLSERTGERMSAGRVQSPAVRLVVERDRTIRSFRPTTHFGARVSFGGEWTADWDVSVQYPDEPSYCLSRSVAEEVANLRDFTVEAYQVENRRVRPNAAFTTATLQQEASVRLRLSPSETMKIAQTLYEKGLITYHRTDNPNISLEGFEALRSFGTQNGLSMVGTRREWETGEHAQEAHEAIRPTDVATDGALELSGAEEKVYRLIRIRALASQTIDAVCRSTKAELKCAWGESYVVFEAKGETIIEEGWKCLWKDIVEEEDSPNPIPVLKERQKISATSGEVIDRRTRAPKHFTEASLIKELERQGIGRPATYAAIMEKIQQSGYVIKDNKQRLHSTPRGEQMTDALVGKLSFINMSFTSAMEAELDQVAQGKRSYPDVLAKANHALGMELKSLMEGMKGAGTSTYKCGRCKSDLRRVSKKGKCNFWGCTKYPECTETYEDCRGKPDYEGRARRVGRNSQAER